LPAQGDDQARRDLPPGRRPPERRGAPPAVALYSSATMRGAIVSFNLLLVLAAAAPAAPAQSPAPDDELQAGIHQVKEGDFETAVVTLDRVARRLAAAPARRKERAEAYLYLGVAQIALDQRAAAKTSYKEAIAADKDLRVSPDRFSPKVIAAFEEARREA